MAHRDALTHATVRARGRTAALLLAVVVSSLRPAPLLAAPAEKAPDMTTVDFGFRAGQDTFNRGEYLQAARTWTDAAELMPETAAYKQNRAGIYAYIAEAYEKAIAGGAGEDVVREAAARLDAYVERYAAAYPGEPAGERVLRAQASFRAEVEKLDAAAKQASEPEPQPEEVEPPPPPPPAPKPSKGLAAGGGVMVGAGVAMLVVAGAGVARGNSFENRIEDPNSQCYAGQLTGDCADLDRKGKAANGLFVAGLVAAPLLLGAGVALLVVAAKRKSANQSVTPIAGPGVAGLLFQRRF